MEALFLWPKVLDSVISTVRNLKNHLKTKKIYTQSWVTTHDSTN